MRYFLTLILALILCTVTKAQAIRDINLNYLYSPEEIFSFQMKPFRTTSGWTVAYNLQVRDTTSQADDFKISWEVRDWFNEKDGTAITPDIVQNVKRNALAGTASFTKFPLKKILVARVTHTVLKQAWIYYQILLPEYPFTNALKIGDDISTSDVAKLHTSVAFADNSSSKIISRYSNVFPAAALPFAAQGKVSKGFSPDSTFVIGAGQSFTPNKKGLYLLQGDTTSGEGFAFRVEDDYPRLGKLESLPDPLIYLCTREEFLKLKAAKEKKEFDKVILGITHDQDRARKLFRSYFRRVELANTFFTSYKEGWKTDRGMIYIIFGVPNEIQRNDEREVWRYSNSEYKVNFTFVPSSTLFDPDNMVLIRDDKFTDPWYAVIELWRMARF